MSGCEQTYTMDSDTTASRQRHRRTRTSRKGGKTPNPTRKSPVEKIEIMKDLTNNKLN